jgi:serine protease Do
MGASQRLVVVALFAVGVGLARSAEAETPRRGKPVAAPPSKPAPVSAGPLCSGEYADDLAILQTRMREVDRQPYSYCVRNTATYECISYGPDGNIRKTRRRAVMHGTAFGYRQQGAETLLLTNQHVAEWPVVTDDEHAVDGVPAGCKRVAEAVRIVDGESDAYEADDVKLERVVADAQLDVAVLRAHTRLHVLPWKIGSSSALRERNVVEVRGFPLGAFQATSVGKVISAHDRDRYREWEHDDFVVDALLSSGSSGSPVLAVSCRTGEFELVGVYHAGYSEGSALNVVVGIDQVRGLMTTLKRTPRGGDGAPLEAEARSRLAAGSALADAFFPFGTLTAAVQRRSDGALVFQVFSRDFPLKAQPVLVIEDLPPPSPRSPEFGVLGRVWVGGAAGLKEHARGELDAETQAVLARTLDALRRDAVQTAAFRASAREAPRSRERFDQMAQRERAMRRTAAARRDQVVAVLELAERLAPHGPEVGVPLSEAFVVPAPRDDDDGPDESAAR